MADSKASGSIIGGILLIAGSCIGAGMLALPILTGLAGFFPALVMFFCAWTFMTLTGLLLVEVNGWFVDKVNFITMAGHTLGRAGRVLSWVLYLFLFYALLVAYISGSGNLSSTFLSSSMMLQIPIWAGSLFFVLLFGWLIYLGTRPVDLWNRILMAGKILAFVGMVALGIKYVQPGLLLRTDSPAMIASLPVLIIAFGYHNMVPTLVSYMKGDLKRVRMTILGGSLFALVIYLVWEVIVLGIVPLEGTSGIVDSLSQDKEASQAVAGVLGSSWVSTFGQVLAFFAILTSFLAQGLSLVHFLADGLKIQVKQRENIWLCALALVPPLVLSLIYPQLFFKALNFAGGICAVILFGILPASMVWIGRYRKGVASPYQVSGGKPLLVGIFLFSLFILFFQISSMLK
jgi:tyrosine-specific transport protein